MNVSYVKLGVMEETVVATATTATTKPIPLSSLLYEKTVKLIMVVKMLGRSFFNTSKVDVSAQCYDDGKQFDNINMNERAILVPHS